MKKILFVFLLSVLAVSVQAVEQKKLVIYWSKAAGPDRLAFKRFLSPFTRAQPDIEVIVRYFTPEDFKRNYMSWFTDSDADLIFSPAGTHLKDLAKRNLIADLTPLWEKNQWHREFSEASRVTVSYKEGIYAVPLSFYPWGLFYKRAVFKRLAITPPETWPQFLAVCEKLKEHDIYPIAIGTKNLWSAAAWFDYINLRLNGIVFHHELLGGLHSFHESRVKNTLKYWKVLIDADYYMPNRKNKRHRDAIPYLLHEKGGMMLSGSFILRKVNKKFESEMGFLRFPDILDSDIYTEDAPLDVYIMTKRSKNTREAHLFLEYIASDTAQIWHSDHNKTLPALISSQRMRTPFEKSAYQLLNNAAEYAQYFDRDALPEIQQAGLEGFANFIENGDISQLANKLEAARLRDLAK